MIHYRLKENYRHSKCLSTPKGYKIAYDLRPKTFSLMFFSPSMGYSGILMDENNFKNIFCLSGYNIISSMASKPIGLEPVLSLTEKSCIASNYRQFPTNITIKIIKLKPVLFVRAFVPSGLTKLVSIL